MISAKQIIGYLLEKPFEPIQIRMASERTFEVRQTEMAFTGISTLRVHTIFSDEKEEKWHAVSLTLIESIESISPTGSSHNS